MEISNLKGLEAKSEERGTSSSHIVRIFQEEVDASLTWAFVSWMREVTQLPILVKVRGLQTVPEGAFSIPKECFCEVPLKWLALL